MDYFSKGWIPHVQGAVGNGNYIEAFLCLHMFIESDLVGCVICATYNNSIPSDDWKDREESYPIKEKEWNNFDFKTAARTCLFMDVFDERFFQRLMRFNSARNKLAHRLLKNKIDDNFLQKEISLGIKLSDELNDILNDLESDLD